MFILKIISYKTNLKITTQILFTFRVWWEVLLLWMAFDCVFYVFISFSYFNKLGLVHMAYITYIHFSKEECEQIVFLIT